MLIVFAVYASIYIRLRNRPVQSKSAQNGLTARSWAISSTFLDESTQGESSAVAENINIGWELLQSYLKLETRSAKMMQSLEPSGADMIYSTYEEKNCN